MNKSFASYTMPIVDHPFKAEFEQAIIAAGVFSMMDFGREVLKPALARMGFASRKALQKAESLVQDLPENAIIQIQGKPLEFIEPGAVAFELTPEGIFVPLAA